MPPPRQGRGLEIAAVILISAGSFLIPVLGWIVGVVLLWVSRRFTRADKLIGMLVPPLGFFAPFFLLFTASGTSHSTPCVTHTVPNGTATSCTIHTTSTPAVLPIVILVVLLAAAVYTVIRLSRRIARMA